MTADSPAPTVSVCIPTCRRPQLLRRAIESVLAQTWQDWELIISDDEDPPGGTWKHLTELQKQDARVTALHCGAPHGQAANTNRTLLAARGEWLKPLHDDDVLRPDCLETLVSAARCLPSAVMVSGRIARYRDGRPVAEAKAGRGAWLEMLPQRYVHLAMYLQDCHAGVPTQVMVNRKAIKQGALFADTPGIVFSADALWNCEVLKHGDLLYVNRVVAEHHQGHETLTSRKTADRLAAEYPIVLAKVRENIDPNLHPPPFEAALGMANCIRVFYEFKKRKFAVGFRLAWGIGRLASWMLAARWAVNQAFPGALHAVPRIRLEGTGYPAAAGGRSAGGAAKETHR